MKFLFSLFFLFFCLNTFSRDLILIHHQLKKEDERLLKRVLQKNLEIPLSFFKLKHHEKPCLQKSKAIFHLCFLDLKNWKVLKRNQEVMERMILKIGFFEDEKPQKAFK